MREHIKSAEAPSPSISPQFSIFAFASAFCLGIVGPMLYFTTHGSPVIDPACIGLLFAARSLGRIWPRPTSATASCQKRLAIWLLIAALGYGILAVCGGMHFPLLVTYGLICLAVFLIGLTIGEVPFGRWFTQGLDRRFSALQSISLFGFVLGCVTIALFGHRDLPTYVLATSDLLLGGSVAAVISLVAACGVMMQSGGCSDAKLDPTETCPSTPTCRRRWLAGLCADSAFGMGVVSAPLTMWETYQFHPAQLGLFFAVVTLISMASTALAGSVRRSIPLGFLFTAIGLFGFVAALYLSRVTDPFNGMRAGSWVVWTSGVVASIGHGLLRSALPKSAARSSPPNEMGTIVIATSAVFASLIWAIHQRVSLALPGLIALSGLGLWFWGGSTNRRILAKAEDLTGRETPELMESG
jgi:hypothetical protein